MKKSELRQIIREELLSLIEESSWQRKADLVYTKNRTLSKLLDVYDYAFHGNEYDYNKVSKKLHNNIEKNGTNDLKSMEDLIFKFLKSRQKYSFDLFKKEFPEEYEQVLKTATDKNLRDLAKYMLYLEINEHDLYMKSQR